MGSSAVKSSATSVRFSESRIETPTKSDQRSAENSGGSRLNAPPAAGGRSVGSSANDESNSRSMTDPSNAGSRLIDPVARSDHVGSRLENPASASGGGRTDIPTGGGGGRFDNAGNRMDIVSGTAAGGTGRPDSVASRLISTQYQQPQGKLYIYTYLIHWPQYSLSNWFRLEATTCKKFLCKLLIHLSRP